MLLTNNKEYHVNFITYNSWNRVQTMTYPDGEVVTYHYNAAGQVESLTSNKQGRQSVIVDRIGYDKEGHTGFLIRLPYWDEDNRLMVLSDNDKTNRLHLQCCR